MAICPGGLGGGGVIDYEGGMAHPDTPRIAVTPAAAQAFRDAREAEGEELHLTVSPTYQHDLFFAAPAEGAVAVDAGGIAIYVDPESARRADGVSIDYVTGPFGAGFRIKNPNEPPRVMQLPVEDLKAMLDRGEGLALFDVRTDRERAIAVIAGARHLDGEGQAYLEGLDKATPIVFHCHHGMRSQAAAERALAQGFTRVYNLRGGIDAWSLTIDPSVPRY